MRSGLLFSTFLAALVSLAIGGTAVALAEDSALLPGTFRVDVEAGHLTLEAQDAPLSDVLRSIGERAGFETILVGDIADSVSTSFSGVPVGDGVERLVRGIDRVVLYAPRREGSTEIAVSQLWLFGADGAPGTAMAGVTGPAAVEGLQQTGKNTRAGDVLRLANSDAKEEAIDKLARVIREDENPFVRSRAATGLGALRDERAVPALEYALQDEHASVRMQAIDALGRIGGERATTALGDVLLYGTQRKQRIQAAWALGRLDTDLARSFLDTVADDPDEQVWTASRTPPGSAQGPAIEAPQGAERQGSEFIR